jgi:hypothetical protein
MEGGSPVRPILGYRGPVAKVWPSEPSPSQIESARRYLNRGLASGAVVYVVVAAVAFWVGSPIVGVALIVGGTVGLPLAKRSMDRKLERHRD